MVELLSQWVPRWIRPFVEQGRGDGDEELLWISWVFGHELLFYTILHYLTYNCTVKIDPKRYEKRLCCPSGLYLEDVKYVNTLGIQGQTSSSPVLSLEHEKPLEQCKINTLLNHFHGSSSRVREKPRLDTHKYGCG